MVHSYFELVSPRTAEKLQLCTGEAIQGGSEKVGWKCTRLWGTSNCQEMLQADLQKLKEDRKNLRKAIRNNQKEARKQAKRKQRLVKAALTVVFVFLPPVLAAGRQDVVEGRPGAVDSGQTGGFHLTNECGHFFASQDQEATTEERTFEVKVCQLLTHGLFVSFPAVGDVRRLQPHAGCPVNQSSPCPVKVRLSLDTFCF